SLSINLALFDGSTLIKSLLLSLYQLIGFPRFAFKLSEVNFLATPEFTSITHNSTDRKSTRLNSSHVKISYAVFCLKKKRKLYILFKDENPTFLKPRQRVYIFYVCEYSTI